MTDLVEIKLNPSAVVAPILRALTETIEVTSICLKAIDDATLAEIAEVTGSRGLTFTYRGVGRSEEQKKTGYTNWLLSKGFQELARAVRQSLESAYIYTAVVNYGRSQEEGTFGGLRDAIVRARSRAERTSFPQLMEAVNAGLSEPLSFEGEFQSLQNVRNCLEHNNGRVTATRADENGVLKLSFPRLMMFYEEDGREIEIGVGSEIDSGETERSLMIKMRLVSDERK